MRDHRRPRRRRRRHRRRQAEDEDADATAGGTVGRGRLGGPGSGHGWARGARPAAAPGRRHRRRPVGAELADQLGDADLVGAARRARPARPRRRRLVRRPGPGWLLDLLVDSLDVRAPDEGDTIGERHLLRAANLEYTAMGKVMAHGAVR